jgi:hypothetical protein
VTTCPTCGVDRTLTVDYRVANERAARLLLAEFTRLRDEAFPDDAEDGDVHGNWHYSLERLFELLQLRITRLAHGVGELE